MKDNMYSNPEQESLLTRPIEAMRKDDVEPTRAQATVVKMLATQPKHTPHVPAFRYIAIAGAAATLAGIALWPQPSSAASLKAVIAAIKQQQARYEKITRRDSHGEMKLVEEMWYAPGKEAMISPDGHESRSSGNVSYSYWPSEGYQVIQPGGAMEADSVSVEAFVESPYSKLIASAEAGPVTRYIFQMGATRQELEIDRKTKLPLRRIVHWDNDKELEIHEYAFNPALASNFFEPHVKPGVPLYNVTDDRANLAAMLKRRPLTQTVAGIKVSLYGVLVDPGGTVDVILTGGGLAKRESIKPLEIDGHAGALFYPMPYAHRGGSPIMLGGQPARIEWTAFGRGAKFPDRISVRIPVYSEGEAKATAAGQSNSRSRLVGWATFQVAPLKVFSAMTLRPDSDEPNGVGTTGIANTAKTVERS